MRLLIDNARVWDGSGAAPFPGKVLIEDNRIAAVVPAGRGPRRWRRRRTARRGRKVPDAGHGRGSCPSVVRRHPARHGAGRAAARGSCADDHGCGPQAPGRGLHQCRLGRGRQDPPRHRGARRDRPGRDRRAAPAGGEPRADRDRRPGRRAAPAPRPAELRRRRRRARRGPQDGAALPARGRRHHQAQHLGDIGTEFGSVRRRGHDRRRGGRRRRGRPHDRPAGGRACPRVGSP